LFRGRDDRARALIDARAAVVRERGAATRSVWPIGFRCGAGAHTRTDRHTLGPLPQTPSRSGMSLADLPIGPPPAHRPVPRSVVPIIGRLLINRLVTLFAILQIQADSHDDR
jgi:hypothetical protein